MKTFLSILFVVVGLAVKAQTTYGLVEIVSVTDTLNTGDTLVIKWKKNGTGNRYKIDVFTQYDLVQVCYYDNADLSNLPSVGGIYTKKVKMTSNYGTGTGKVLSNDTPGGFLRFFIRTDVGVPEYDPKATITGIKYYDVMGRENTGTTGELLVKTTIYSNGYIKKDKVILAP